VERVSALGKFGITLKILGTVRASEQWAVAGELRKRLLAAFQESGIEMPQPQRVVLAQSTPALAPPLGAAIAADAPASAETPSEPDTPADAAVAAQETTKGPPG
jgi:hypothetical protein